MVQQSWDALLIYLSDFLSKLADPSKLEVGDYFAILGFLGTAFLILKWLIKQANSGLRIYREHQLFKNQFLSDYYTSETIQRSTQFYVLPDCASVDPGQEAEIRNVIATRSSLFEEVLRFINLKDQEKEVRHLLILADSGMGKTAFILNFYAKHYHSLKKQNLNLVILPLGIPNVDEEIAKINSPETTILFLDAFDEDTKAIQDHYTRIKTLMEMCHKFRQVVITCRTQFFPKADEIPVKTGIAKFGDRSAGDSGEYLFQKLYIQPLSDDQVERYLKKRFPLRQRNKRKQAKELVDKIPNLRVRPMLLTYIPEILNEGKVVNTGYGLYELLVESWIKREERFIPNSDDLRAFSKRLAFNLYVNREARGAEWIPYEDLLALRGEWDVNLENWQLSGRSLLNRDAQGNFKFAHRSIMEFLFVQYFLKLPVEQRKFFKWTDQMRLFLFERLIYDGEALSLNCVDLKGIEIEGSLLNKVNWEGANFGKGEDVPEWIINGLDPEGFYSQKILLQAIGQGFKNLIGANLIEVNLEEANLIEADLEGADLRGANLVGGDLKGAHLERADLSEAILDRVFFEGSNLKGAKGLPEWVVKGTSIKGFYFQENLLQAIGKGFKNLRGADLSRSDLSRANLIEANLIEANLIRVKLFGADLSGADLSGAILDRAYLDDSNLKGAKGLPEWVVNGTNLIGIYSQGKLLQAIRKGFKNLRGADLSGSNLRKADLSEADLSGSNLRKADLSRSNLRKADLSEADLSRSNLSETDLSKADLSKADLRGGQRLPEWVKRGMNADGIYSQEKLIQAIYAGFKNLRGANLNRANLVGVNLVGVNLVGANLVGANLVRVNLVRADLSIAKLGKANLKGAKLGKANLIGADLSEADMNEANLIGADLSKADLIGADLRGGQGLPEWVKRGMNADGTYFQEKLIQAIYAGFKNLRGANLNRADLSGANLVGGNLVRADLSEAQLVRANLLKADLSEAQLVRANLLEADLSEAKLGWANLLEADLSRANLKGAKLGKANLRGTNLSGVNLSWANLKEIKFDINTKFPPDFQPKAKVTK